MDCRVCGITLEEGRVRCPKCGFPVMMMVVGDQQEQDKIVQLAADYRRKKLTGASVALKVYTNELEDAEAGSVKVRQTEEIPLALGESLGGQEIIWYPEKFARLIGNPVLDVSVTNGRGETYTRTLTADNPGIEDFWQVGVKPEPGLSCRLVLGNQETYTATEAISLL